jgi:hypothetical protein
MGPGREYLEILEADVVVGHQSTRRAAHRLEQEVMHSGLIEDHVWKLGETVGGVPHSAAARYPAAVARVGLPERGLVDPVGLTDQPLAETERLEHLDRATGNAIGLPELQRPRPSLDDACRDPGELRELGGQNKAGRTTADDQNIDFALILEIRSSRFVGDGSNRRVARMEAV